MNRSDGHCRRWTRRRLLQAGGLLAASAASASWAQLAAPLPDGSLLTPGAVRAVEKGLAYLKTRQRNDGSLEVAGEPVAEPIAVTALTGMAFLASGSTPGRGPYGGALAGCVDYLSGRIDTRGFIGGIDVNRPMYGHGFALLMLAEVYGMAAVMSLRRGLAAAVRLTIESQNAEGGWRYHPRPEDADVSVTACQLIGLRAAHNAGLDVPAETVRRAVEYLVATQNPDGGFRYMVADGPSGFPRSAAVLMALLAAGMRGDPVIGRAVDYVQQFKAPAEVPDGRMLDAPPDSYFFYGHYYAAQAMWQIGGQAWEPWYAAIRDLLVASQMPDGSWQSSISREYATAMACFTLQIPLHAVPVLQR